jgi:hypothetical protein
MFFNGWESLLRTVVVGVLAYVSLIVLLRISGMRTLSKMNAFDLSGMLAKRPFSELRSSVRDHPVAAGWCHGFDFQQIQGGQQIILWDVERKLGRTTNSCKQNGSR